VQAFGSQIPPGSEPDACEGQYLFAESSHRQNVTPFKQLLPSQARDLDLLTI
jgi:hypothetical protein